MLEQPEFVYSMLQARARYQRRVRVLGGVARPRVAHSVVCVALSLGLFLSPTDALTVDFLTFAVLLCVFVIHGNAVQQVKNYNFWIRNCCF